MKGKGLYMVFIKILAKKWLFILIIFTPLISINGNDGGLIYCLSEQYRDDYVPFPPYINGPDTIVYFTYNYDYEYKLEFKIEERYNNNGKLFEKTWQTGDSFDYFNYKQQKKYYNESNLIDLEQNYIWDYDSDDWKLMEEYQYSYQYEEILYERKYLKRIGNDDTLMTINKYIYIFNEDHILIQSLFLVRDTISLKWDSIELINYEYLGDNIITSTIQKWNDVRKAWINDYQIFSEYENGLLDSVLIKVWLKKEQIWTDYRREILSYDDSKNRIQSISKFYYSPLYSFWQEEYKAVYSYVDDRLIKVEYSFWDITNQGFEVNERVDFQYDTHGNWLSTTYSKLNNAGTDINENYIITYEEIPIENPTDQTTLISNETKEIFIFPNPVTQDYILINRFENNELIQYTIYTINGIVAKQGICDSEKIYISRLNPGFYIISIISANNKKYTLKFIKK